MNNDDSINPGIIPRVAYLALGSNLGDRSWNIAEAITRLRAHDRIRITQASKVHETAPMYVEDQPEFLNACVEVETTLGARGLLQACLDIEEQMGRVRELQNGPRLIDIDLLMYEDEVTDQAGLSLPHPAMLERDFVLIPLSEIAGDIVHPRSGRTIAQELRLLRASTDS